MPHSKGSLREIPATTLVMLKADRTVSHGRVVAIMDAARSNGLTRLAIVTEIQSADRGGRE